jgi:hypothetical protein
MLLFDQEKEESKRGGLFLILSQGNGKMDE